jgi:hypothetical protein
MVCGVVPVWPFLPTGVIILCRPHPDHTVKQMTHVRGVKFCFKLARPQASCERRKVDADMK